MSYDRESVHVQSLAILSALFLLLMVVILPQQAAFGATVNASIVRGATSKTTDAYSPYPIKVNVGDKVIWTNQDTTTHVVRSGKPGNPTNYFGSDGSGNSILIGPGKTYAFTFEQPGVFPYFCTIHQNMVGKVLVGTLIAINNVASTEGDSGTKSFTFKVTRSGITSGASSVKYATASSTAIAGSDFVSKSGTISFAAGQTSKSITIAVKGDTTVEPDEKFRVNLSNCISCSIIDNRGIGTIRNDDP